MESDAPIVPVSAERLQELLRLEASLPTMIDAAVKDYKKNNLERLHARDKENPDAVKLRVKRYVERHRDEINAKRREKRRLVKEMLKANAESSAAAADGSETARSESSAASSASTASATSTGITIRKIVRIADSTLNVLRNNAYERKSRRSGYASGGAGASNSETGDVEVDTRREPVLDVAHDITVRFDI